MSPGGDTAKIARDLIHIGRKLAGHGWLPATDGNLSARTGVDRVLLTAAGVEKSELTEEMLVELGVQDLNPGRGSTEWLVHRTLYGSRPDVQAVLHVHSPFLTAFAAAHRIPQNSILAEASVAIGKIVLVNYETPGTPALAHALRLAGIDASIFLLANHGAVAVGTGIREAYHRLVRAEFLAEVEWRTDALGGARPLSAEQITELQSMVSAAAQSGKR
jgi:L-fuculose-phosphate aldolase